MSTDPPIACTLTGSAYTDRLAQMTDLGHETLLERTDTATGTELRFRPGASTRATLDEIVRAEQSCCAFLNFEMTDTPNALVLQINGPQDSRAIVDELADAFAGREQAA